jgi:hypothetical protein
MRARDGKARIFGKSGESARSRSILIAGVLALALLAVALAETNPAVAVNWKNGELVGTVTGAIVPAKLPRSQPVPATVRIGFTSEARDSTETPELTSIAFYISPSVTFRTAGLPSCPIARLLSSYGNARQTCARSLVGHGSVVSEVTLPGRAPITIHGHLLAFYDEEVLGNGSRPYILAQVTSGGEEPLTYVIPFRFERRAPELGTRLIVRQMRRVLGKPAYGGAYRFSGIYGHISSFKLSLHRLFTRDRKHESFVSADCPRSKHPREAPLIPSLEWSFTYAGGAHPFAIGNWRCVPTG